MGNYSQIRKKYNIPACFARVVVYDGKRGILVKDGGDTIGVLFDENEIGDIVYIHPTNNVTYLGVEVPRKNLKPRE
jgi:hypothetical protein